jgi:guanylate kinase
VKKRSVKQGVLFIISGPSGSGKTTLVEELLESSQVREKLVKSRSFTTRPPRSGERHKKDYIFISRSNFNRQLAAKKILEWIKYLGYYYGTPGDFLKIQLAKGKSIVLCLDLKGALKVKRFYPGNTVTIFILPPSLKVLRERIQRRCHKTAKAEIDKRVALARRELSAAARYDYRLVNNNFNQALKRLKHIVLSTIKQVTER